MCVCMYRHKCVCTAVPIPLKSHDLFDDKAVYSV